MMFKNKDDKKGKTPKNKKRQSKTLTELVVEQASEMSSNYDPMGSYTGNPSDSSQKPIQDADDL